ncbi:MAG: FadR/GntR family transcriptional regulator [Deinococcota bacterium]
MKSSFMSSARSVTSQVTDKREPSRRPRLHDDVSKALLAMIRREELATGERLPPEPDLAKHFSVSRGTLRAAVQELTLLGFLEVKQGAGTFVRQPDRQDLVQPFQALLAGEPQLAGDLLQLRRLLEPEVARLAAGSCTEQDSIHLQTLVETQVARVANGADLANEDVQLHSAIAHIAGNQLICNILMMMRSLLQEQDYQSAPEAEAETVKQHQTIVSAITAHEPELARAAMITHLAWVEQVLTDKGIRV